MTEKQLLESRSKSKKSLMKKNKKPLTFAEQMKEELKNDTINNINSPDFEQGSKSPSGVKVKYVEN